MTEDPLISHALQLKIKHLVEQSDEFLLGFSVDVPITEMYDPGSHCFELCALGRAYDRLVQARDNLSHEQWVATITDGRTGDEMLQVLWSTMKELESLESTED